MSKKFKHLNLSPHWQQYFSKYPQGYTIIENLIDWVSQVDEMVDNQNELNATVETYGNRLDEFIGQYDTHLQETVEQTLSEWQDTGFLDVVINSALDTKYHEMDNRLSTQLTYLKSRKVYVTEEPYNAIGDGVTDDTQAIKQAYSDCQPNDTLVFKSDVGFLVSETLVFDKQVNLDMQAPVMIGDLLNRPSFIVGNEQGTMGTRKLHHKLASYRKQRTNWTNKQDIGILLLNQFSNKVDVIQSENYTVGVKAYATDGKGFSHNQVSLYDVVNNKFHLVLANKESGYVNENIFYGGRFTNFGSDLPDDLVSEDRRAILIESEDNSYTNNNNNIFIKPSFQNRGGTGIEIIDGAMNKVIGARSELGGTAVEFGKNAVNNEIEIMYATSTSEGVINNSNNSSNIVHFGRYKDLTQANKTVFKANDLISSYEEKATGEGRVATFNGYSLLDVSGVGPLRTYTALENVNIEDTHIGLTGVAIGKYVDTSKVKKFVLNIGHLDDTDHWVLIRGFDNSNNILTDTHFVYGSGRQGEQFNAYQYKSYRTTSTSSNVSFEVDSSVKKIFIGIGRSSSATAKITGFELLTPEVGYVNVMSS